MSTTDEPRPTFLARVARKPFPVLFGLAVGFLGCCVAGRVAAHQQPYKNFVRFHQGIAPESHYYPTFSQTLNLARRHAEPGKTLVVVGGNSVMNGVGQRRRSVWSLHLQKQLGDRYVVLNLAMRGQWANEFGGVIAERLAADGVPVIYVTLGTESDGWGCDWAGGRYPYLFWDGYGKGQIPSDPRRDAWLEHEFYERFERPEPEAAARRARDARRNQVIEERHRGDVDGVAYASDLWTYLADRHLATVWTPLKYPKFWRPHRGTSDDEAGDTIPFENRNPPANYEHEVRLVRSIVQSETAKRLLRGEGAERVGAAFAQSLPDRMRDRTLYVLRMEATVFRNRLPPDERAAYAEVYHRIRSAVRAAGLNIEVVGEHYVTRDYADRSHFSEQGGRKMAEDLAPAIRAMNEKLYGSASGRAEGDQP